ncbi:alpha/beta-type small acid-soluble spore protein [Paenibacillus thermotolerans]|uniref:alpha/beta-type small acid-soluble spore protein n=1 Tax=Paenibacillus thermotolerans TaxID=3027807 RepID=UPI0023675B48|nr:MULTISPECIES: alpha/beta-type small acid-soluble spore protein [unclassified Paenibacillus]
MARRSRRLLVPQAGLGMSMLKADIMRREGYAVDPNRPETVKYAVAQKLGVPLEPGYNGGLTTEDAGKVGGAIGGQMVRELIRRAQQQLAGQPSGGGEPHDGTRPWR